MHEPTPHVTGPGQESVWDYPRPPALDRTDELIVVEFGGIIIAETSRPWRVLETSHPPTYYIPIGDVKPGVLVENPKRSFCEFKGRAAYFDVVGEDGRREDAAAWYYPLPAERYDVLSEAVAFYPGRMDICTVDGEVVRTVQGDFYGGWVTSRIAGPFKGEMAGSSHW